MRSTQLATFLFITGLTACATTADTERALLARVDQFHQAIREGDPDKYADLFTDDFLFTWSRDGQIYDKQVILPNVVPTPDFEPVVDEYVVRTHGKAAVVSYRVRQDPSEAGVRVTFSYVKQRGVWKVMASHSTKIVAAGDPESNSDDR